jgi:hypothetical protein
VLSLKKIMSRSKVLLVAMMAAAAVVLATVVVVEARQESLAPTTKSSTSTTLSDRKPWQPPRVNVTAEQGKYMENNQTLVDSYMKLIPNVSSTTNAATNVDQLIKVLQKLDKAEDEIKWHPLHGKTVKVSVWKRILVEANHGLQLMKQHLVGVVAKHAMHNNTMKAAAGMVANSRQQIKLLNTEARMLAQNMKDLEKRIKIMKSKSNLSERLHAELRDDNLSNTARSEMRKARTATNKVANEMSDVLKKLGTLLQEATIRNSKNKEIVDALGLDSIKEYDAAVLTLKNQITSKEKDIEESEKAAHEAIGDALLLRHTINKRQSQINAQTLATKEAQKRISEYNALVKQVNEMIGSN